MGARLTIGLLNNMPDGALQATERQFESRLAAASRGLDIELRFFSLPEVERGEHARARMRGVYADASALPAAGLDGLIVTGAEPRTPEQHLYQYPFAVSAMPVGSCSRTRWGMSWPEANCLIP